MVVHMISLPVDGFNHHLFTGSISSSVSKIRFFFAVEFGADPIDSLFPEVGVVAMDFCESFDVDAFPFPVLKDVRPGGVAFDFSVETTLTCLSWLWRLIFESATISSSLSSASFF